MTLDARFRILLAGLAVICCVLAPGSFAIGKIAANQLEKNKQIVLAHTLAEGEHDVPKAASFLSDDYIEHNANTGRLDKQGFIEHFSKRWPDGPIASPKEPLTPAEIVAEGNMVVLIFMLPRVDPIDPAKTYQSAQFEAYRVIGGKITEHWDASSLKTAPTAR